MNSQTLTLGAYADEVVKLSAEWTSAGKVRQLWAGDAKLWTNTDEAKWVGWMHITEAQLADIDAIEKIDATGFTDAVVLGMGGSELVSVGCWSKPLAR